MLDIEQIIDRKNILELSYNRNISHLSSAFSMIDYFKILYNNYIKNNSNNKLILDKSYGSAVYYYILDDKYGNKSVVDDEFNGYYSGTDILTNTVGVTIGFLLKDKISKFFLNIGDASLVNGLNHEGFLHIGVNSLHNIIMTVDRNKRGAIGPLKDGVIDFKKYFESINWIFDECNGHSQIEILKTFYRNMNNDKPTCIFFNTIKGKGISELEKNNNSHAEKLNYDSYIEYMSELNNYIKFKELIDYQADVYRWKFDLVETKGI